MVSRPEVSVLVLRPKKGLDNNTEIFQNNFGAVMHLSDSSCAPILQFFDAVLDGATANRQIPDRIFGQFCTSLSKDSVANYASIWTLFSPAIRGFGVLYNALKRFVVPLVGGATRFANLWRIFSKTQKIGRMCQILRIVTIYIVINSTHV